MSLAQVVPLASISAIASRVPVRTKSSPTQRASAGQMWSCSQSISVWSSARPRSSVMAAWPWVLTSPGISRWSSRAVSSGRAERPGEAIGRDHGHDAPVAQRDGMVFQHGVARVDRQDPARADDLVDVLQYPSRVARVP